jgi:hypothetical protein
VLATTTGIGQLTRTAEPYLVEMDVPRGRVPLELDDAGTHSIAGVENVDVVDLQAVRRASVLECGCNFVSVYEVFCRSAASGPVSVL